ncbi:putative gustatory receptor 59c [Drosophila teissieri]|uniref:putative gustatory receptor 59c n=1 Tax=Drosophila teissieri TaxID=7243 RepID=UPI001CBA2A75|nr:putative gustatory receptor 59c [Drosophila teissieri]
MVDLVRTILLFAYCYGLVVGVFNFEVDWLTGGANATRRTTIYAAVHNTGLITLLIWLCLRQDSLISELGTARHLHEYFFLVMSAVRIFAVLLSLLTRWYQRCRFIRMWNQILALVRDRPQVVRGRWYRRSIVLKFVSCVLSDTLHTISDVSAQRKRITADLMVKLGLLATLTTIFNVIVCQYYLAMVQVIGLYQILLQDLRCLVREAACTCAIRNRRGGVYSIRCCSLADQLDLIAERHYTLRDRLDEMSELFQIQSLSMSLVYFFSTMGSIYFSLCAILYNSTGFGSTYWGLLLIVLSTASFYMDNWLSVTIGLHIRDQQDELVRVLSDRTLFSRELDNRLEVAFENFQLQLASNRNDFYVVGLFKMERSRLIAMLSSVITHTMVLVQWEIQNNGS